MTKQEEYKKTKVIVDKDGNRVQNNTSTISSQRAFDNKGDLDSITGNRIKGGIGKNLKMLGNVGMFVSNLKNGKMGEKSRGDMRK